MKIAYVDDSKQVGRRTDMGQLLALGAVIFDESAIRPFSESFYAIFDEFNIPHSLELKWSYSQKSNWFRENGRTSIQSELRRRVISAAAQNGAQVVAIVWDLDGGVDKVGGLNPQQAIIKFLFERVSMQILSAQSVGIMVFDKPGGDSKDEERWLGNTIDLTRGGTEYVASGAVIAPFLTAPSHYHPHIQLADLIVGAVTNAVAGGKYGIELLPAIKPMFCLNFHGLIGGTGLKLYPDKLINLHYWLNAESMFTRNKGGVSLPAGSFGWRYADSSGLDSA